MDTKIRELIKEFNVQKEEYIKVEKAKYEPLREKYFLQEVQQLLDEKEYYVDSQGRKLFGNWQVIYTSTTINFTNVKTEGCKCAWIEELGGIECNTLSNIATGNHSTIDINSFDFEDNLYRLGEQKLDLISSLENRIMYFKKSIDYINNHREINEYRWGYYCDKDQKEFATIKEFFEYVVKKIG